MVGLFLALLVATWMRWPDPLVDFWRNLYIPWRLSEGALLYEDVADAFGPLASLAAAAVFGLAGPSLEALAVLDAVVAVACLGLLHRVLRRVGDRLSAWVGAAAFVLVFCFGHYSQLGNYNFITPYVTQATWGFLGLLLALEGALETTGAEQEPRGWLVAGAGLAVAWLSKPEALLAAAAVVTLAMVLRRRVLPLRLVAGVAAVGAPIGLLLALEGGPAHALGALNKVVSFTASPQVRAALRSDPIFSGELGTDRPWENLGEHLAAGLVVLATLAVVAGAPWLWQRSRLGCGAVLASGGLALVLGTDWPHAGRGFLVPVVLTAGATTLAAARGAARWAPLSLLSVGALAMLSRMALNVRLYHYGFTLAVLAAMVVIHLLVFEAPRWWASPAGSPWWLPLAGAALVLGGSARLLAHSAQLYAAKSVRVGTGRDAMLGFGPGQHRNPGLVNEMLAAVERSAPGARTLLAFPDSAAVSYLSRRPSPIPEFDFNPVALAVLGPAQVVARLEAHPPDAVLLCSFDLRSHGAAYFGATEASGKGILEWIRAHYVRVESGPPGPFSATGHLWDLFVRKPPAAP